MFEDWYSAEINLSTENIPNVCCLSTIGIDGFPNARMIALKEIKDKKFIFTSSLDSLKGVEIQSTNKVALTFWWNNTERQVRIQGVAERLSDEEADKQFEKRSFESKVATLLCQQGRKLESYETLKEQYIGLLNSMKGQQIDRPKNWGGFEVTPLMIEFMQFHSNRLHERNQYELNNGNWNKILLQP